ncbi:hypothetical protein BGZ83_005078, partial [Gryganskiella cystojenkinii]
IRGRMREGPGIVPGYKLNEPLDTYGVAEVIASKRADFPVGSIVYGDTRWEEYSV